MIGYTILFMVVWILLDIRGTESILGMATLYLIYQLFVIYIYPILSKVTVTYG